MMMNNSDIRRRNSISFTTSSLRRKLSPTGMLKWPGHKCAQYYVQTHQASVMRNMPGATRYKGTLQAIKFDRNEIAFILAVYPWLKPLKDEGWEVTGLTGKLELPDNGFQKIPHTRARNSSPSRDSNPHSSVGGRRVLGKQTCQLLHHASTCSLRIKDTADRNRKRNASTQSETPEEAVRDLLLGSHDQAEQGQGPCDSKEPLFVTVK